MSKVLAVYVPRLFKVDWHDAPCNEYDDALACDLSKGIKATRISATINKAKAMRGGDRFEVKPAIINFKTESYGAGGSRSQSIRGYIQSLF